MSENDLKIRVSEDKATRYDALRLLKSANMINVTHDEAREFYLKGAEIYSKFYSKSHAYEVFGLAASKKYNDIALELYTLAGNTDFALCGCAQIYEKRKNYEMAEKFYEEALKRVNGSSAMVVRAARRFYERRGKREKIRGLDSMFRRFSI